MLRRPCLMDRATCPIRREERGREFVWKWTRILTSHYLGCHRAYNPRSARKEYIRRFAFTASVRCIISINKESKCVSGACSCTVHLSSFGAHFFKRLFLHSLPFFFAQTWLQMCADSLFTVDIQQSFLFRKPDKVYAVLVSILSQQQDKSFPEALPRSSPWVVFLQRLNCTCK